MDIAAMILAHTIVYGSLAALGTWLLSRPALWHWLYDGLTTFCALYVALVLLRGLLRHLRLGLQVP